MKGAVAASRRVVPRSRARAVGRGVDALLAARAGPDARELATAQLAAALDSLAALQRIIRRTGGFMAPEDQVSLREAEALLVAAGRSVAR